MPVVQEVRWAVPCPRTGGALRARAQSQPCALAAEASRVTARGHPYANSSWYSILVGGIAIFTARRGIASATSWSARSWQFFTCRALSM